MPTKGKQVKNGKAFEYAIAYQYYSYLLNANMNVNLISNAALNTARNAYEEMTAFEKDRFDKAAYNTIATMTKIEPGLTTQIDSSDILDISLNTDRQGEIGDVRDVIFRRDKTNWEIGLSAKNNNDAVKHSRLSNVADFGSAWLNVPCSTNYWEEITPIFSYLEDCITNKLTWNDLGNDKRTKVYVPLLKAFKTELLRINQLSQNIPEKLITYLIGRIPFYKIIKDDAHNLVIVKAYNINGKLNKTYNNVKSSYSTPKISLPRRIVEFEFKENSETTLNMILDKGWEISFRLHNAEGSVVKSLKFDIQLLGNPPVLFTQHIFQ